MWGAAPRRYRRLLLCTIAALGLVALPTAQARVGTSAKRISLPELWGLEVGKGNLKLLNDQTAQQALDAHVNTLLVDNARLTRKQKKHIARLAQRFGFRRITVPHSATRSLRRGSAHCRKAKRHHPRQVCALRANSLKRALRLASVKKADVVVARVKSLPDLADLALSGAKARVVVLVEIGKSGPLDQQAWQTAIKEAAAEPSFDLAVAPAGADSSAALGSYVGLLGSTSLAPSSADRALRPRRDTEHAHGALAATGVLPRAQIRRLRKRRARRGLRYDVRQADPSDVRHRLPRRGGRG